MAVAFSVAWVATCAWAKLLPTEARSAPARVFSCWLRFSWVFDEEIANDFVGRPGGDGLSRFGTMHVRFARPRVLLAIFSLGRHTHRPAALQNAVYPRASGVPAPLWLVCSSCVEFSLLADRQRSVGISSLFFRTRFFRGDSNHFLLTHMDCIRTYPFSTRQFRFNSAQISLEFLMRNSL